MYLVKAPITVVIPCYNCVETIDRAIDSVINQKLLPERLILVDDASKDSTFAKLKEIHSRRLPFEITIIRSQINVGASEARNLGMRENNSIYVAFLDSDDSWHPNKLALQYRWMETRPQAKLIAHYCMVNSQQVIGVDYSQHDFDASVRHVSFRQLLIKTRFSTPSVMIRYDPNILFCSHLRYAEDYEYWLQIAAKSNEVYMSSLPLAQLYKAEFGASGLSSHMWKMLFGVMTVYWRMYKLNFISLGFLVLLELRSVAAFFRRIILKKMNR